MDNQNINKSQNQAENNDQENDFFDYYLSENKPFTEQKDSFVFPEEDKILEENPEETSSLYHLDELDELVEEEELKQEVIPAIKLEAASDLLEKNPSNQAIIKNLLNEIEERIAKIKVLLEQKSENNLTPKNQEKIAEEQEVGSQVVIGFYDGEKMIGENSKEYSISSNYASKSKLLPGDKLKLTINPNGVFVYKQVELIERKSIVGSLRLEDGNKYFVVAPDGRKWRVLKASVSYYHGNPGDEAVILIPKNKESAWGAVENIIRNQFS